MDEEYRAVINRFFGLYRELQRSSNLTMHCSFSAYSDGLIEIWEQKGIRKELYLQSGGKGRYSVL